MEVSISKIIGKYELVSKIGRGSTADVWSAIHKDTKEKVALKIYAKVQHLDEVATIMFEQEFKKSQQFSHPNILKAIDYFIFDKTPILVLPICEGCLEKNLMAKKIDCLESDNNHNLTFNNEEIMNIIKQIASGLALLHDKGIIHNDIKPANIVYITDQNDKKQYFITDFGISLEIKTLVKNENKNKLASAKTVVYASPEKLEGNYTEPKSDIFSLGVVIYELAGGKDMTIVPGEIIRKGGVLKIDNGNISADVQKLMQMCLINDYQKRPTSKDIVTFLDHHDKFGILPQEPKNILIKWVQNLQQIFSKFN